MHRFSAIHLIFRNKPITATSPTLLLMAMGLLFLAACTATGDMTDQPRYKPLEASEFFLDFRSARPVIDETVPWGNVPEAELIVPENEETEMILLPTDEEAAGMEEFPFPITMEVLERGRERYEIFCAPCHGLAGYGDGPIVERGFPAPSSFHIERLRQAPTGHYYNAITNGFGRMFSYAYRVRPMNRWAIIAYIRALQLSQAAPLDTIPADVLEEIDNPQP